MKQYWLFKTEPDTFSIDDLRSATRGFETWDGVRNYQARNFLRDEVKLNQEVFIYHSSCAVPGITGIGKIVRSAYPDANQFNPESPYYDPKSSAAKPRWVCVDVAFVEQWPRVVSLKQLKAFPELADMALVQKGSRLSIQPVAPTQWRFITRLAAQLG
jgi:predicted RNA-binding protein with PUA-like domain